MKSKITCDQLIDQDIHGWGNVEQESSKRPIPEDDFLIELRVGTTAIAQQRRTIQRPDVDRATGQPGVAKGYRMPVLAAAAAVAVLGQPEGLGLSVSFAGGDVSLAKQPPRLLDLGQFRSLRMCEPGGPVFFADLWFASEHELRIRIDKVSKVHGLAPPYRLRFYQPEFVPGVRLALIGEVAVTGDSLNFVSPVLRNPLLPLLITVSAANGDTVAMDLIPFPSLCRGGLHHAELQSLATNAGYIADLRSVSDSFLRDMAGIAGKTAAGRLETLRIDMRGATGTERIMSPAVLQWLVLARRLRVEAAGETGDAECDAMLGRSLAELSGLMAAARRKQGLALTIPADALPCLAALTSQRLNAGADGKPVTCSFLTANVLTGQPLWYVSVPMGGMWWQALQPGHIPALTPVISLAGSGKSDLPGEDQAGRTAMAIRFLDEAMRGDDTRLLPVAPDLPQVLAGSGSNAPVSVVVSVRNNAPLLQDMLASLAAQTVADRVELVIVNNRSFGSVRAAIEAIAAGLFPGRYSVIDYDEPFNHSAQTNAGIAAASNNHVCLIDTDVVLHDPRTIETLLRLSGNAETATAGCMLLEALPGKPNAFKFRSAGVFPAGLTFGGRARLTFSEPDCGAAFGPAVYPVAGNSFALAMLRKDCWQALGGLNGDLLGSDLSDIDYCLRAIDKGYTNLCTTVVSAFHTGRATRGMAFDMLAPDLMVQPNLPALLGNCTVLWRIG